MTKLNHNAQYKPASFVKCGSYVQCMGDGDLKQLGENKGELKYIQNNLDCKPNMDRNMDKSDPEWFLFEFLWGYGNPLHI